MLRVEMLKRDGAMKCLVMREINQLEMQHVGVDVAGEVSVSQCVAG